MMGWQATTPTVNSLCGFGPASPALSAALGALWRRPPAQETLRIRALRVLHKSRLDGPPPRAPMSSEYHARRVCASATQELDSLADEARPLNAPGCVLWR
jgi:hypothetical protein